MLENLKTRFEGLSNYDKKLKLPGLAVCISFLCIHIMMFILFLVHHVTPMVYFNIFSILFYIGTFFLLPRKKERLFVIIVYIEVIVHMFLAIIFVGWGSGFQVTLVGITIMLFYAEYACRVANLPFVNAIVMALGSMSAYIVSYIITEFIPPIYQLPHSTEIMLQILWGCITFIIMIFFLKIFSVVATRAETQLSDQVAHDELTRLFSRHFMTDYLDRIMNEPDRSRYWIAIADIDDFKLVNDTYGHICGDYVLKTLADLLREGLTHSEVCRWGGEEFLMIGQIRNALEGEKYYLETIRQTISDYQFSYEGQPLHITITIGLAGYRGEDSQESWINRADMCLYEGKSSGKNKVVCE